MKENDQMLMSVLGCRNIDLLIGDHQMSKGQALAFQRMKQRRAAGEPLQYVIGETSFLDARILVDPRVLIPRPETEILVERALETVGIKTQRTLSILDLGTGSGNIAIALAMALKGARVTAVDVSPEALEVARNNAEANGVAGQCDFIQSDMKVFLKQAYTQDLKFDLIVSNPPYISTADVSGLPSDVLHEPRLALVGGTDGLDFIRVIFQYACRILNPSGTVLVEIGDGQKGAVEAWAAQYPAYARIHFYQDYVGTDRIAVGTLADSPHSEKRV